MMVALLDTHTFLWWMSDFDRLSPAARDALSDTAARMLLSAASGWEIAIKHRLGRLTLPDPPTVLIPTQMRHHSVDTLPVLMTHALHVHTLPPHHHDPFDRMLVAQAQLESIPIISGDPMIRRYDVQVIW